MAILSLTSIDNQLLAELADGQRIAVHENGFPVQPLLPGWSCTGIVSCFAPIHVMVLFHPDIGHAYWFLDANMQRISLSLSSLAEPYLNELRQRSAAVFGQLHDMVLLPQVPERWFSDFDILDDGLIDALVSLALDDVLTTITVVPLWDTPGSVCGYETDRIREMLDGDLREDYRDVMSGRGMTCVAPDGSGPCIAEFGMIMHDRSTVYRFSNVAVGAFYVTTKDYYDRKISVYIARTRLYAMALHASPVETLLAMLLRHAARHHGRMRRALSDPRPAFTPANFLSDYPTLHIGHVIWNELTGLEELSRTMALSSLPDVVVINSPEGSEPFGAIDALFPSFLGRVRRPEIKWEDAAAFVYDNALFFMRYLSRYVTRRVGERILAQVTSDPCLTSDRVLADRTTLSLRPAILLGLRVGNRAPLDQIGFLALIIQHLIDRLGKVVIVLDGVNCRLGTDTSTSFNTFGPRTGDHDVVEELRIVLALRERFQRSDTTIVRTVGSTLATSLFWANRCRFFVAPWGAALAKYRWVCNLPGFVVTNSHNIGLPVGDLPIYHDPEFVEDPSMMHFIAMEHVTDDPSHHKFYSNFTVEPGAVLAGVDDMIVLTGLSSLA